MTQGDLRKERAALIERVQNELDPLGQALQQKLFDLIIGKFIELFDQTQGKIVFNKQNIAATAALEIVYKKFVQAEEVKFVEQFVSNIQKITGLNIEYNKFFADNITRFDSLADRVKELMRYRLGIDTSGTLLRDGFLLSFINDTQLKNQIKQIIVKAVTNQIPMAALVTDLKINILGEGDAQGLVVKKYKDAIFDVYQQHDRATSKFFGAELGLQAGLYAGGLIDSSREFCIEHNDKVWTVQETEDWINDPNLPKTKAEREAGQVFNYDPIVDMGRWRCRHHWNFVSNSLAKRLRPDLEGIL